MQAVLNSRDNLKVLFRPVACMVPDYALIAEIRLFSYGYHKARILSQKLVTTFKISMEQLSTQDHYDFGMRAINTVILAAGRNKKIHPHVEEEQLLLQALIDSNLPKFIGEDILLFQSIIKDLFTNVERISIIDDKLNSLILDAMKEAKLYPEVKFIEKCTQLNEMTVLRHGLMLIGASGTGKTACYTTLESAYNLIAKKS